MRDIRVRFKTVIEFSDFKELSKYTKRYLVINYNMESFVFNKLRGDDLELNYKDVLKLIKYEREKNELDNDWIDEEEVSKESLDVKVGEITKLLTDMSLIVPIEELIY
jgi:hypothetical protein